MKLIIVILLLIVINIYAERLELSNGSYVDEQGTIYSNKYENEDISAPWNDPLQKDDILAPWNDPLQKDDIFAPWNSLLSGEEETNRYLRESGETNSEYYWK
jgi:hypothetical protein